MGDLNYRVDLVKNNPSMLLGSDTAKPSEEAHLARVKALMAQGELKPLMAADQLRASRATGEAFVGFEEGEYDFLPTFKVKRVPGYEHKDQRIPSYCDRVLWKSMLPQQKRVVQKLLTSVPAVSTSDHKPVVSGFEIAPSLGLPKVRVGMPVIRLSDVTVQGLIDADVQGGSDPYMIFFTNPPEILGPHSQAPISKIKKAVSTTKPEPSDHRRKSVGAAAIGDTIAAVNSAISTSISSVSDGITSLMDKDFAAVKKAMTTEWMDREMPLLRPMVDSSSLANVTLIIAIMDHDIVSKDDPLGYVLVPLVNPSGRPRPTCPAVPVQLESRVVTAVSALRLE